MRIISKEHDYYDGLSKSLDVEGRIWKRERKSIKHPLGKRIFPPAPSYWHRKRHKYVQTINLFGAIGCAGKIYPFAQCYDKNDKFYYDFDYNKKEYNNFWYGTGLSQIPKDNKILSLFEKYQVALFVITNESFVINPILSEYSFYKVLSDWEIFQELDTYLSSGIFDKEVNLNPYKDDEKLKLQAHGMDSKSFKTKISKKKR